MPSSITNAAQPAPNASSVTRPLARGGGASTFSDILTSTTGGGDVRSSDLATATAAGAASADVGILAQLVRGLGGKGAGTMLGVKTIGSDGQIIADAEIGPNGELSVFGSGESGGATSLVSLSMDPQSGGDWSADVSAELAQATYQLNDLAQRSLAASKGTGVDAAA
jgi:hypothetical protein